MRRAALLLAVVGGVMVSSCAGDDTGVSASRNVIATAPEQTTTTNPYAVPAVIDAAYVNRVLAGLDAAVGDVVRMVVTTNPDPHEIAERLKPLYDNRTAALQLSSFRQDASTSYSGYRDNPGNKISSVSEVVSPTTECIFARVARDYRPVVENPNPQLADQWIGIVPSDSARDPEKYNSTGWMYIYDGFEADHTRPNNPCDAVS